jgi:hypothetical protein
MIDVRIQKEKLIHRQPVLLFKDSRAMLIKASGGPVPNLAARSIFLRKSQIRR